MIKKVNFAISQKENHLKQITIHLKGVKAELSEVVDEYEEAGAKMGTMDSLYESLAAIDDAIDAINDVLE